MSVYSSQIIKTLSDQVQNLLPLRQSYHHLRSYYAKLVKDFEELISLGNISQADVQSKLAYLEQLKRQLEEEAYKTAEDAKILQSQYAKSIMEANQKAAHCQALQNKWHLELGQQQTLLEKRSDLTEENQSIQFNISKYKEMIHNLQLSIKNKEYQNLQIQRQIKKMELINSKIEQFNQQSEQNITKVQTQNQKITEEISTLQNKIDTYDKLINTKQKMNRQSMELLISKTKQLKQLKNRNEYMTKLVETQEIDRVALSRNCYELQSFLKLKKQKLMGLKQQNQQYEKAIDDERKKRQQSKKHLGQLSYRLKTFIETNQTLYRALERSCSEDRDIQIKLSEKLEKLLLTGEKITTNDILHQFDVNSLSKYQNFADLAAGRRRSSVKPRNQNINENESTGEDVFHQVRNQISD